MLDIRPVSGAVVVLPALLVLLLSADGGAGAATQSPFRTLDGVWSGGGRIQLDSGNSERVSCRANYSQRGGGTGLGMSIRCASSSYKIELRAALANAAGTVSGTWEERTFNAAGTVSGRASGTTLSLAFSGSFSGSMSVTVGERQQRVSITTDGGGFRGVSISLSKS